MNEKNFKLAAGLIGVSYATQSQEARKTLENQVSTLLSQRRLPDEGWAPIQIEAFLHDLACMDSNNFPNNVGVGEREARIFSSIVASRHFHMGHGVGRSGDLASLQPKAAGSSLLYRLANCFALDVLKRSGVPSTRAAIVVPLATGMSISLVLLYLKSINPRGEVVLIPRIDQKTCLKCIQTAGLRPVVVDNTLEGDEVRTSLPALTAAIEAQPNPESILCVMTVNSCFAPRVPDRLVEVAQVCKARGIPHVVNNAYAVQARKSLNMLETATRQGRVDAYIQSTDKNFMVPVGGAIIASARPEVIEAVSQLYPGRASAAPVVDFFVTMLEMGWNRYRSLVDERLETMGYLHEQLEKVAAAVGERMLCTPHNPISMGMTLTTLEQCGVNPEELGGALFLRCVSGTRVVTRAQKRTVAGLAFEAYGSHLAGGFPLPYLTCAAGLGMQREDVDQMCARLRKSLLDLGAHAPLPPPPPPPPPAAVVAAPTTAAAPPTAVAGAGENHPEQNGTPAIATQSAATTPHEVEEVSDRTPALATTHHPAATANITPPPAPRSG
ncbi:O-phosphoseryl-tRNA(Sec) selenium transferase [Paratrimastix pyriformis]|uniref:O-phosphoseryl-tRNA(Sec) selenium transferase n=1 Tax=Paratrimastix pyriformis TaxID=342808 RepID=A0ABQ8U7Y9_9EUKA|nr:O-phosphoseryl-tRNA(Sec) selenium transferase [Paratrimastix pyriformis]